jgi:hypothetical protein
METIRDHHGLWIKDFSGSIGYATNMIAELWAFRLVLYWFRVFSVLMLLLNRVLLFFLYIFYLNIY